MIHRKFPHILDAWMRLIDELAYEIDEKKVLSSPTRALPGKKLVASFSDVLCVDITDALRDENLHLGMSSFTRVRWKAFLKRYFRPDLAKWVDDTTKEIGSLSNGYQVAGYSININPPRVKTARVGHGSAKGGHRHGACLCSLQIQVQPEPRVILFSRASQIDKAGFLDLCLIHLVAKRMGLAKVKGLWVVSNASITAANETFHTARFKRPLKGHCLGETIGRFLKYDQTCYGPLKRMLKRIEQVKKHGEVQRSCKVSELSLEF